MTGGNFRLLTRLLTQIERVLSVNNLRLVSTAVVEAGRDSLVIGQGCDETPEGNSQRQIIDLQD